MKIFGASFEIPIPNFKNNKLRHAAVGVLEGDHG